MTIHDLPENDLGALGKGHGGSAPAGDPVYLELGTPRLEVAGTTTHRCGSFERRAIAKYVGLGGRVTDESVEAVREMHRSLHRRLGLEVPG